MASAVSAAARDDQEEGLSTLLRQTRTRASELLGVIRQGRHRPHHRYQAVAAGLDWQAGDEVLIYQDDFPVNVIHGRP